MTVDDPKITGCWISIADDNDDYEEGDDGRGANINDYYDNDEVNFSQASSVTSARQMREVLVLMKRTLAGWLSLTSALVFINIVHFVVDGIVISIVVAFHHCLH